MVAVTVEFSPQHSSATLVVCFHEHAQRLAGLHAELARVVQGGVHQHVQAVGFEDVDGRRATEMQYKLA